MMRCLDHMRIYWVGMGIIGLGFLSGCLNRDDDCSQQDAFTNQELYYLVDDLQNNYLSFGPTLETAIQTCEQDIVPVDTIGFENIYSVDGAIVGDCRAPGCIRATAYKDPFCIVDVPSSEEDFDLIGRWRIAYVEKNNKQMPPSCLQSSENLIIGTNSDSTVYQLLSAFALSDLVVDFQPRGTNTMRISEVFAESGSGPVYLELFERTILEAFQATEVVAYSIRDNIMTMELANDTRILLFANP